MKLIIVRHGESTRNAKISAPKNSLTNKGTKQAKKISEILKKEKIDAIYCSSVLRCQQTLNIILENQINHLNINFSFLLAPKKKSESLQSLTKRIILFLNDLQNEYCENDTVLIISHQYPIRMINQIIIGDSKKVENCSVCYLTLNNPATSSVC